MRCGTILFAKNIRKHYHIIIILHMRKAPPCFLLCVRITIGLLGFMLKGVDVAGAAVVFCTYALFSLSSHSDEKINNDKNKSEKKVTAEKMLNAKEYDGERKKMVSPHHLCNVCVFVRLFYFNLLSVFDFSGQSMCVFVCVCFCCRLSEFLTREHLGFNRILCIFFCCVVALPLPLPLLPQNPFKHMHIYSLVSPSKRSYPVTYFSSDMIAILLLSLYFCIFPCRVCVCVFGYGVPSIQYCAVLAVYFRCIALLLLVSIICTLSTMLQYMNK